MGELIGDHGALATEPAILEVAAGPPLPPERPNLRRLLLRFDLLRFDAVAEFDGAATIYRRSRQAGVTPRGMVGCMIASVAARHGASLLAAVADLRRVATAVGIHMDAASTPA